MMNMRSAPWRALLGALSLGRAPLALAASPAASPAVAAPERALPEAPAAPVRERRRPLARLHAATLQRLTPAWGIALLATALSIGAFALYAHQGLTLAYGDSISHMMIARRVFFSRTPGLAQLGTVWLPFTHMLMLPFIWVNALFYSGLAGALPSMAAYVVGAVYLYRLGHLALNSIPAGVIAALVFLLNPSTLYMQSTPMTELPLMSLAIVAIFYAVRWAHNFHAPDLVMCAAATFGATLVRYDAWALAGALCVIILVVAWRRSGWQAAEASTLLYGTFALAGCAAWLMYQQIIVGNALDFLNGPYSSAREQQRLFSINRLQTLHNPVLSLEVYAQATLDTVGWPILIAALIGVAIWLARSGAQMRALPLYSLFIPFVFNWYSLVRGNSALETPEFSFGGIHTYYNERYGLMMVPAIALFCGYAASRIRWSVLPSAILLFVLAIQGAILATPYVLQDALVGVDKPTAWQQQEVAWFVGNCAHGTTLISESAAGFESVIFYSHLPLSQFVTNASGAQYTAAIAHPENVATCLVMDSHATTFEPVWEALHNRTDWQPHFALVAQFGTSLFYQRITTPSQAGAGTPPPTGVAATASMMLARPTTDQPFATNARRYA